MKTLEILKYTGRNDKWAVRTFDKDASPQYSFNIATIKFHKNTGAVIGDVYTGGSLNADYIRQIADFMDNLNKEFDFS